MAANLSLLLMVIKPCKTGGDHIWVEHQAKPNINGRDKAVGFRSSTQPTKKVLTDWSTPIHHNMNVC